MAKKEQTRQEPQARQPQQGVSVTGEDISRFIPDALFELKKVLHEARKKHGPRYNEKNKYEQALRKFDFNDAEKVAHEWVKIREKRSTLSSTMRSVFKEVGDAAMALAIREKLQAEAKKKQQEAQAAKEATEGK